MRQSHRRFLGLEMRERPIFNEELRKEIVPVGVGALDQIYLPFALIFLQPLLTVDRRLDAIVPFVPNEPLDPVLLGEAVHCTFAMLDGTI